MARKLVIWWLPPAEPHVLLFRSQKFLDYLKSVALDGPYTKNWKGKHRRAWVVKVVTCWLDTVLSGSYRERNFTGANGDGRDSRREGVTSLAAGLQVYCCTEVGLCLGLCLTTILLPLLFGMRVRGLLVSSLVEPPPGGGAPLPATRLKLLLLFAAPPPGPSSCGHAELR